MNIQAQRDFKQEINDAETLADVLGVLQKYYDVKACKTGPVVKSLLLANMNKLVLTTRCQPKKEFA